MKNNLEFGLNGASQSSLSSIDKIVSDAKIDSTRPLSVSLFTNDLLRGFLLPETLDALPKRFPIFGCTHAIKIQIQMCQIWKRF